MTSATLRRVQRAAAKAAVAREALEAAIREAHKDGATLRAIGDAAGMSYETVRRICQQ